MLISRAVLIFPALLFLTTAADTVEQSRVQSFGRKLSVNATRSLLIRAYLCNEFTCRDTVFCSVKAKTGQRIDIAIVATVDPATLVIKDVGDKITYESFDDHDQVDAIESLASDGLEPIANYSDQDVALANNQYSLGLEIALECIAHSLIEI